MRNKLIPYRQDLKQLARQLRKQSTIGEIILWKQLQRKAFGVQFHRQVPLLDYIVDFYCHELKLAIEVDGLTHVIDDVAGDALRQKRIEEYGVAFLRFNSEEISTNISGVNRIIENTIAELSHRE